MPPRAPARLTRAVLEIEQHVAAGGWDQPIRLYALVPTRELLASQPDLAAQLGADLELGLAQDPGHLTPVEQEDLPEADTLEDLLAGLAWPTGVVGAGVVVERVMLPPDAEAALPDDDAAALAYVAAHPRRQEVRLAVGVLRDGSRECALRMRAADDDRSVRSGSDLVPGLAQALAATFAEGPRRR